MKDKDQEILGLCLFMEISDRINKMRSECDEIRYYSFLEDVDKLLKRRMCDVRMDYMEKMGM